MKRTLVTTDTHGELPALLDLFKQAEFDYQEDRLIHLGDVVDRGVDSFGVVEELIKIKNLIAIRGNHDDWFNTYIHIGLHPAPYYFSECRNSYTVNGDVKIPQRHKDFFASQIISYTDEHNRFFCHAGFETEDLVQDQNDEEFFWNRYLWERALSVHNGQRLNDINGFDQIFIGHTPTFNTRIGGKRVTEPMYKAQVVNLDTGGVFGGKHSMIDITDPHNHILYQS